MASRGAVLSSAAATQQAQLTSGLWSGIHPERPEQAAGVTQHDVSAFVTQCQSCVNRDRVVLGFINLLLNLHAHPKFPSITAPHATMECGPN